MRALVACGTGRYADPWHPFPRTSTLLAAIVEDAGFAVAVDDDVDGAMTRLDGVDLLVVNAGDPWRGADPAATAPEEAVDGFARALDRGIGVLAVHSAVSSLRDYPEWAPAIGAMWVPGLSHHPPAGRTSVTGAPLPDGTVIRGFDVVDERYCRIQRLARNHVVAHHRHAGRREPTAWVRDRGRSRVAVDLLGHDERAYDAEGHRTLVGRLAGWVTARM